MQIFYMVVAIVLFCFAIVSGNLAADGQGAVWVLWMATCAMSAVSFAVLAAGENRRR